MNFKFTFLMWPLLLLALTWGVQAQTKLAIVNMNDALIGTKDGQKAVSELSAKQATKVKEFEKAKRDPHVAGSTQ